MCSVDIVYGLTGLCNQTIFPITLRHKIDKIYRLYNYTTNVHPLLFIMHLKCFPSLLGIYKRKKYWIVQLVIPKKWLEHTSCHIMKSIMVSKPASRNFPGGCECSNRPSMELLYCQMSKNTYCNIRVHPCNSQVWFSWLTCRFSSPSHKTGHMLSNMQCSFMNCLSNICPVHSWISQSSCAIILFSLLLY